jgi:formate dehydrogenase subunit gamma
MKKKLNLALALIAVAMLAIGLLGWTMAEPAASHPGYSCNPAAGHGSAGCHRSVTPTTKPKTTTTKPKTTTTKPRATTTNSTAASSTTTATSVLGSTTTAAGSTTVSEDSTTSVTDPSTAIDPAAANTESTTGYEESTPTTDLAELVAAIVAIGAGGGGGPTGGWTALLLGLGILAGAGWALLISKWATGRQKSGGLHAARTGLLRFVLAERLGHWVYVLCFLAAGVTGALMWIPSTAQRLAEAYFTVARLHGYLGLAMAITPLLIFLVLDRRRLAENRRTLGQWSAHDRRWLRMALAGGMFRGKRMPPQGRFNAGQKVNSILVVGLTLAFVVTGSLLIARGHLPAGLAAGILLGHKVLAVFGGTLLVGHVGMAVLTPHGRGGLKAMIKGILPAHIAREGHALWYADWVRHLRQEGLNEPTAGR